MQPKIKYLGVTNFETTWQAMKDFVSGNPDHDEIWITEHFPIYTTGLNKKNHVPPSNHIPHVFVDRGGKITYHGPGQLIIYILFNLSKQKISIRNLVSALENSIIQFLQEESIEAYSDRTAPGVYVNKKKIASVGLRLKNKYVYHGLSFNVNMDLTPFSFISPCGYENLEMTQLVDYKKGYNLEAVGEKIIKFLVKNIGNYEEANH